MSLVPETVVERGELWTVAVNRNQNLLGKTVLVLNRPEVSVARLSVEVVALLIAVPLRYHWYR